jgi:hypothetical protein
VQNPPCRMARGKFWRKLMRTRGWVIFGVAVVIAGVGAWTVHRVVEQAHIGTAYVAKLTCSCLFVSHRSLQSCATDYDAAAVRPLTREVAAQSVTVSALGHVIATRAVFEPGFGCHLVN